MHKLGWFISDLMENMVGQIGDNHRRIVKMENTEQQSYVVGQLKTDHLLKVGRTL